MKRPQEHEYTSHVAYSRALEAYCNLLEQPAQDDPCLGCRKGVVCRTLKCGRFKLPVDHPFRPQQLAQDKPVAWLITDENINNLQVDSIQRLIDRARHAHMTDIKLRINGQDEWFQADWLKHMVKATRPQAREPQPCPYVVSTREGTHHCSLSQREPLTDEAIWRMYKNLWMFHPAEEPRLAGDILKFARAIEAAHGIKGES